MNKKRHKFLSTKREFTPDGRIILRDQLSIERTRLANERTLLSYIRSSLYLLIGSFAFFQLKDEYSNFDYLAYISLVFSIVFFVIGIHRFYVLRRSLNRLYDMAENIEA
ncbi:DUF202 domain-containing protein [Aestuariibaculum sp. M13]|uniref:DUF202 domain-containing protein n=1 Tax=Aestuariibaculum sp. M13 TaxID=2967132 RepID=UPI002159D562|nr:DUF202 domain-containing protein [Aestuariibaculum sp. M13]MCR8668413.1 DUF202 domain-containing protein [Aestuariibaculum sp. M13]